LAISSVNPSIPSSLQHPWNLACAAKAANDGPGLRLGASAKL
jgi:hypothetical protein